MTGAGAPRGLVRPRLPSDVLGVLGGGLRPVTLPVSAPASSVPRRSPLGPQPGPRSRYRPRLPRCPGGPHSAPNRVLGLQTQVLGGSKRTSLYLQAQKLLVQGGESYVLVMYAWLLNECVVCVVDSSLRLHLAFHASDHMQSQMSHFTLSCLYLYHVTAILQVVSYLYYTLSEIKLATVYVRYLWHC